MNEFTMKNIVWVMVGATITCYALLDIERKKAERYTIKDKEYVEGCKRVQQARLADGMSMDQYWDQGCKRVLKTVD
jgi:hypothetical protein